MTRHEAREILLHIVFAAGFLGSVNVEHMLNRERLSQIADEAEVYKVNLDSKSNAYISAAADGVLKHMGQIDMYIKKYAKGWDVDRMTKMTAAILRLAVYEMMYEPEIPVSVSINEAVEFAKKYDDDNAPQFINGVLGGIARGENLT